MKKLIQLLICLFIVFAPVLYSGVVSAQEAKDANANADNKQTEEMSVINIRATPWATVTVDKVRRGTTPISVKVPAGKHKVEVTFPPKAKTTTQDVTTEPGQKLKFVCDMNAESDNCKPTTEAPENLGSKLINNYKRNITTREAPKTNEANDNTSTTEKDEAPKKKDNSKLKNPSKNNPKAKPNRLDDIDMELPF